jgi:PAS domain S-box-containing protein
MSTLTRRLLPFAFAGAAVVFLAGLRGMVLAPFLEETSPYAGFALAILASAGIGGLWPGIFATLLSAGAGWFLFLQPSDASGAPHLVATITFSATGIFISAVCELLMRRRRRAERKLAELENSQSRLQSSEQRFRNLADSAPVLIWISDENKHCTWFNRPWLEFTGRSIEQEQNDGWRENIHPEDRDRCVSAFSKSFDAREPFEMDYRLRRHDGAYRWMLDRGIPFSAADGSFLGYMGSVVDINERKEAEENREALLRIEHASRIEAERAALMKDEFLATVSHEMRTPLNAMLGWVQLLRSGCLGSDSVAHALETVERNARSQATLINDLLDVSKVLSGRLRLEVQQMSVIDAAEAAISTVEPAAAAKNIRLVRSYPSENEVISGDPSRVQQMIWNLLNNGVKFTPSGGEVELSVRRDGQQIEIRVSDNGEGMHPDFLPHVFDRFRQQDSSTGRRHQGLGLGLSIVKQLTELHGGSVEAESDGPGRGSVFVLRLPVAADRAPRAAVSRDPGMSAVELLPESLPSLLGVKVLVVDDDRDARELLRAILAHHGASVRTAESAADALSQFDARPPQVLVSDIAMPDEDGYTLIRKVRERSDGEGGRIPAVALTAFARSEDRRTAIAAGFNMHLSKPVEPAELLTVVASLANE